MTVVWGMVCAWIGFILGFTIAAIMGANGDDEQ